MSDNYWIHVTRGDSCPICDSDDWCSVSIDGAYCICRREHHPTGQELRDKNDAIYWLYRIENAPASRSTPTGQLVAQKPTRAHVQVLHTIYGALLNQLTLTTHHRDNLLARGLRPQEITSRRYRTLPNRGRWRLAQQLVERFGPDTCQTVPGLHLVEREGRAWWSLAGAPGIVIPVRDLDGRIVALKMRADTPPPGVSRYTYISSNTHGGPGPGSPVHIPLHDQQPTQTLRITEGEMKADIATVLSGVLTLSVPGVQSWRSALPILETLKPTKVLLAFDSDWRSNAHVADALRAAILTLQRTNYDLLVEMWNPTHGKGIDDVLAHNHPTHGMPPTRALGALGHVGARLGTRALPTLNTTEVLSWRLP